MNKLNVLYICYEDITGFNGAIRHVTEIIKGLSRNGHKVTLCVPRLRYQGPDINLENVNICYIPTIPFRGIRPLSYLILSILYLPWIFLRVKPDITYIREIKFTFLPVLLAKLYKTPCILEVNGLLDESEKIRKVKRMTSLWLAKLRKWNLSKANHIITVTTGIKDDMIARFGVQPEKISIITNGVDLSYFKPAPISEARARIGLAPENKLIGFVGGLFPWHGLDQLVQAAPYVLKEVPSAKFIIVGSGMEEKIIKKMVGEYNLNHAFIFTGSVPFQKVSDYINSFNICVVFFKKVRKDPGDPIKLYEYLACGRPVVASNVNGYGDVVETIGGGVSVDSCDPEKTSEALVNLLKDDKTAEVMGTKGFQKAQASFGWDRKVTETEHIIDGLLVK